MQRGRWHSDAGLESGALRQAQGERAGFGVQRKVRRAVFAAPRAQLQTTQIDTSP